MQQRKVNYENSENCLCPGYVEGRRGLYGVCICGLHWKGWMPMHTRAGRPVSEKLAERWYKHTREEIAVFVRRQAEKHAFEQARLDKMRIVVKPRVTLEKA